jgi:hypothetical protein
MENHTMRVLQSFFISVCLGLMIHGVYAQKGSIHLNIPPQSLASALKALARLRDRGVVLMEANIPDLTAVVAGDRT